MKSLNERSRPACSSMTGFGAERKLGSEVGAFRFGAASGPADRRAHASAHDPSSHSVRNSFVDPDVFHAPAIKDAVDHEGHPFHIRLHAGAAHAIEDDRPSVVLR